MKGYIYYDTLPLDIRLKFKIAYDGDTYEESFETYLNRNFEDMHSFIGSGFVWDKTEDGHEYWEDIANGVWDINQFMGKPIMRHTL